MLSTRYDQSDIVRMSTTPVDYRISTQKRKRRNKGSESSAAAYSPCYSSRNSGGVAWRNHFKSIVDHSDEPRLRGCKCSQTCRQHMRQLRASDSSRSNNGVDLREFYKTCSEHYAENEDTQNGDTKTNA